MIRYVPAGESDFETDSEDSFELFDEKLEHSGSLITHYNTKVHQDTCGKLPNYPCSTNNTVDVKKEYALVLIDLQNAITSGNTKVVSHSIEILKNPDVILGSGWTPLMYAVYFAQAEVTELLLSEGANVNMKTAGGASALHVACRCPSNDRTEELEKCIACLLRAGANVCAADATGKTSFMYAASRKNMKTIVTFFLNREEKMNFIHLRDEKGWDALDWAAAYGQVENIKLLLAAGIKRSQKSPSYSLWPKNVIGFLGTQNLDLDDSPDTLEEEELKVDTLENNNEETKSTAGSNLLEEPIQECVVPALIKQEDMKTEEYETYGQLELFLLGLDLSYLIPLFKDQDITFDQLLCFTMKDLEIVGVTKLGARKRILDAIHQCHIQHSKSSVLPDLTTTVLTFDNMINMVNEASDQITYISSCLRYIRQHIEMYPEVLQPTDPVKYDKPPMDTLKEKLNSMLTSIYTLSASLKCAQEQVTKTEQETAKTKLTPSDMIMESKFRTNVITKRSYFLLGIATICVMVACIHKSRFLT